MNKKKIYRLLDNDKVVVNNFLLEVLADKGVEHINDWLPNYSGDERLTVIPVKPTTEWKPYLKDYVIDWSRIDERVRLILD